jgi:hypothetical protein
MNHVRNRNSLVGRCVAILVMVMMVIASMSLTQWGRQTASADTSTNSPSVTKFATPEQLVDSSNFSLYREANAETSAVAQKVYFGTNEGKAQGWYIAGAEDSNGDGNTDLVLVCDALNPLEKRIFNSGTDEVSYTGENTGTYVNGETPETVYTNHYGTSEIRAYLNSLVGSTSSLFTASQIGMIVPTTIYTMDTKNNTVYSTTDKLYLGYGEKDGEYITLGLNTESNLNSGINVGVVYECGTSNSPYRQSAKWVWLRTPDSNLWALCAYTLTGYGVTNSAVYKSSESCDVDPAFSLDLSSVAFASAAKASKADASLDTGFTLRLNAESGDATKIVSTAKYKSSCVTVKKDAADSDIYLYVQGKDGNKDWVYSQKIEKDSTTVKAADIQTAKGLSSGVDLTNCKVWLETTDTSADLTYAKMATEVTSTTVNGSPEADSGVVTVDEEMQQANVAESGIANTAAELKNILLTDEEKDLLETGEDITVWVEVKDNEENTPEEDIQLIADKLTDGYDVGAYLDVTLWKQVGEEEAEQITQVENGKVKVSLTVPEDLQKEGRTYQIIRVHDGVATVLDTDLNKENYSLTFETDAFSTYALTYKDPVVTGADKTLNKGTVTKDKTANDKAAASKDKDAAADTSDSLNFTGWAALFLAAVIGLIALAATRRREE